MLQDVHFLEQMPHFNRAQVIERPSHANTLGTDDDSSTLPRILVREAIGEG